MKRKINENEQLFEILQSCALVLNCPRLKHYPNKNFGSHLKAQENDVTVKSALDYARQAVKELDGVFIKSVRHCDDGIIFNVLINNEEGEVTVKL